MLNMVYVVMFDKIPKGEAGGLALDFFLGGGDYIFISFLLIFAPTTPCQYENV